MAEGISSAAIATSATTTVTLSITTTRRVCEEFIQATREPNGILGLGFYIRAAACSDQAQQPEFQAHLSGFVRLDFSLSNDGN
ncbi:hypothetical protein Leryth_001732 [Lithospermum erythrorhizon]|nr:hypothetical protein Leryth_001732 [Lithospermum erythrorhizon]